MEKRLFRSYNNKMIAGVAGGLGEYFNFDPVLIRIIFVVTTLFSGVGLITYILLWIIVPYETVTVSGVNEATVNSEPIKPQYERHKNRASNIFGIILITIGVLFLADNFIPFFGFHHFWPLILVAIGAGLILKSPKK